MASTTFNGPVRSEKGFQVATKNTTTGAITTRMSSGMPDLTGLALNDLATGTITLDDNSLNVVNYTGAAAAVATLPAAEAGSNPRSANDPVNGDFADACDRIAGAYRASVGRKSDAGTERERPHPARGSG